MFPLTGGDCPSEDELAELVHRGLSIEGTSGIEVHLARCAGCRAALAEIVAADDANALRSKDSLSLEDPALAPGSLIGRYRVIELLGSGAMGSVYVALDPELDRRVALKVLRSIVSDEAEDLGNRLRREAKAMAKLSHPNVVTVHDVGTSEGRVFLAMELVEGATLRDWLASARHSWREIVEVFVLAGRGLSAAHSAGLVHRDFKPDNVLVTGEGDVRVTNFGLARESSGATEEPLGRVKYSEPVRAESRLTRTGTVIGTPAYMAPEQLDRRGADVQSDLFSFCVALWEGLYGQRPFRGATSVQLREAIRSGRVTPETTGDVSRLVRDALLIGLRDDPAERYASMAPLLDRLVAGTTPRAPAPLLRSLGWVLALALCAAGIAGVRALATRRHDAAARASCRADGDAIATSWNPTSRDAARRAMLAEPDTGAPERTDRTLERLDDYAEAWRKEQTGACEATRLRKAETITMYERRSQCLLDARTELEFFSELLARDDHVLHVRSVRAAGALLRPLENCTARATEFTPSTHATGAPTRDIAIAVRREILRAEVLDVSGHPVESERLAEHAIVSARDAHDGALEARGEFVLASTLEAWSQKRDALRHFRQAVSGAESVGADDLAGRAAIRVAFNLLQSSQLSDEGLGWLEFARGKLARLGHDDELAYRIADTDFLVGMAREDTRAVLDASARMLDLRRYVDGEPRLKGCFDSRLHGVVSLFLRDLANAEQSFRRAVECKVQVGGRDFFELGDDYENLAEAQRYMGQWDDAIASVRRAREVRLKFDPEDHWLARTFAEGSLALDGSGKYAEAEREARRAIDMADGDPRMLGMAFHGLGLAREGQGDPRGAKTACTHSLEVSPSDQTQFYDEDVLLCVGEAELALGEVAAARLHVERSIALQLRKTPGDLAVARFLLARALTASSPGTASPPPETVRARVLAQQARDELRAIVPSYPFRQSVLDDVERWLTGHGSPTR